LSTSPRPSQSQHIAELARELLDDIELSRVPPQALILKASRLARFVGTEKIQSWLSFELHAYADDNPVALEYIDYTGRWIDREKRLAYWGSFAEQVAAIESLQAELGTIRLPDVSGDYVAVALHNVMNRAQQIGNQIRTHERVKNRVLALLHRWVSSVHYETTFGGAAESIFERFRKEVDARLADACSEILERLPLVYDRLRDGDSESISQAMTSCRRIIDGFADAVFPPTADSLELEGSTLKLGPQHHQNRIYAYVVSKTDSKSRRKRLRQTLSNLYDRVCAGVHDELSVQEAQSLVLQTYVLMGEIATLEVPRRGDRGDPARNLTTGSDPILNRDP
jgi:hypothetical protein